VTEYTAFKVELTDNIAHVQINRPEKINAMNAAFWEEIVDIFQWIDDTDAVRAVVISGAGKHFSSGIDLMMLASLAGQLGKDVGRNARLLRRTILRLQARSTPWTTAASRCWRRSRATASAAPST
jgi:enoyl-CoA hydratase